MSTMPLITFIPHHQQKFIEIKFFQFFSKSAGPDVGVPGADPRLQPRVAHVVPPVHTATPLILTGSACSTRAPCIIGWVIFWDSNISQ